MKSKDERVLWCFYHIYMLYHIYYSIPENKHLVFQNVHVHVCVCACCRCDSAADDSVIVLECREVNGLWLVITHSEREASISEIT